MRLKCRYEVNAAHQLTAGVPADHPCARLHGHRYNIAVTIIGDVDPGTGMILEYAEIDNRVWRVLRLIDHWSLNTLSTRIPAYNPNSERDMKYLGAANAVSNNPTVELLAEWLKIALAQEFDDVRAVGRLKPQLYAVEIEEDRDHVVEI